MSGTVTLETLAPRMERIAGSSVVNGWSLYASRPTYQPTIYSYTTKQPINNNNRSSHNSSSNINSSNINTSSFQYNDEPDNKTNEQQLLFPKLIHRMNDIFHREDERLKTFDHWPLEWLDKNELARTGMFYTGDADKVKCYFCEVEIGRWEEQDLPLPEHLRWSPNCPLLRRRTTNNVPIDIEALDRILPPISYDLCGANDPIEVRPFAYAEGTISMTPRLGNANSLTSSSSMSTNAAMSSASCTPTATYYPEYPEYAIEAARMRSFAEWPRHMKQRPEQLSEAGFFYTGSGDRVKCFSCGGGLKDWDEHDDPWEQHALWLNKCRFLNLIKGQSYVEGVLAKQKAQETEAVMKPMDTVLHKPNHNTLMPACVTAAAAETTTTTTTTLNCDVAPMTQKSHECLPGNRQLAAKEILSAATATAATSTNIPEEKLCKICYAGEYNTAFLPCGHVVACAKCASSVTKCPLCRKPFTDVMRVYFS